MYQVTFRSVTAWLLLGVSLFACQPAPPVIVPDFSLEASLTNTSLKPNSSTTVGIKVIPENGFNADVSLSSVVIESAAKLSSSYAPSQTKANSTLTLMADPSSTPGSYTVLVKGAALIDGKLETREVSLEVTINAPTTISVTGTVLNSLGQPIAGVGVKIGAQPSVTTDALGAFEVLDVTKPYNASVFIGSQVHVFNGLTRANPKLALLNNTGGAPLSGLSTVAGTLSGGAGFPNPANHIAQVVFSHPTAVTNYATGNVKNVAGLLSAQGGAYSLPAQWTGTSTVNGTLYALQWATDPASLSRPTTYKGYGSKNVSLSNGVNSNSQNIVLSAVTTGSINVALTPSSGTTVQGRAVSINFDSRSFMALVNELSPDTNATYAVPDIAGKSMTVTVSATNPKGNSLLQKSGVQAGNVVNMAIPTPASLISPADNLSNVGSSITLNYVPVPKTISVVLIANSSQSTFYYTTSATYTQAVLPTKKYSWGIFSLGEYADLDAFTGENWSNGYPSIGLNRDFAFFTSNTRNFTTK